MDFRIGPGIAGVHDTGNVMEDVRFFGGRYGIWTRTPSPGWQFTAIDMSFEGQREAAIRETAAGLTLIRPHFRSVPTAISIDAGCARRTLDQGRAGSRTSRARPSSSASRRTRAPRSTWRTSSAAACRRSRRCATAARRSPAPAGIYEVKTFSHGLHYADIDGAWRDEEHASTPRRSRQCRRR